MKITVIGTGYVGLVSSACFAELGNNVLCLDLDVEKINKLKKGEIPIHEPGLEELVFKNVQAGRLKFTTDIKESVEHGFFQFIAVGTPPGGDGSADMQYVIMAAKNIGMHMASEKIIVNKSTVPVGTADKVGQVILDQMRLRKVEINFDVVSNPEFLKEGAAINDFMKPDRIIIGVNKVNSAQLMKQLYSPFQRNHERLQLMDTRSAELTKYAANAMLATRISFMNELALLAEKLGADIDQIRRGIGSDPRIGYDFLYAGCGYGGSCFPKDIKALMKTAMDTGLNLKIVDAVEQVNEHQKGVMVEKVCKRFGKDLRGKQFGLWGLAFKPNTDDMREAPSCKIIKELLSLGATIVAYDPVAINEAKKVFKDVNGLTFVNTQLDVASDSDALIVVTEWKEFKSPDFTEIKNRLKNAVVFDGRNLYDVKELNSIGIEYYGIGRGNNN